jgi:hypothetical protein
VQSFTERLYKPQLQVGYVELRKGYHSYINSEGELVVLRAGALREQMVIYNPATTLNQQQQKTKRAEGGNSKDKRRRHRESREARKNAATINNNNSGNNEAEHEEVWVGKILEVEDRAEDGVENNDVEQAVQSSVAVENGDVELVTSGTEVTPHKIIVQCNMTSTESSHVVQLEYDSKSIGDMGVQDYPSALGLGEHNLSQGNSQSVQALLESVDKSAHSIILGPWHVSISVVQTAESGLELAIERVMRQIEDILPGRFSYNILIDANSHTTGNGVSTTLYLLHDAMYSADMLLAQCKLENGDLHCIDASRYRQVADLQPWVSVDLRAMEVRLRDGLPLLVPAKRATKGGNQQPWQTLLKLDYQYVGIH